MMNLRRLVLKIFFLMLLIPALFANEKIESSDYEILLTKAQDLTQKCSPSKILIVTDIDNTILSTNQNLGGDAWFNWQQELIAKKDLANAVASDFQGLLKAQELIFSLSSMHSPDKQNPSVIKNLQSLGYPTIALTSRGYNLHDLTERELKKNGYDFTEKAIGAYHGYAGNYIPYLLNETEKYGIAENEATQWKLLEAMPVGYFDGVFYTSGQHKGAMLRTLLKKTNFSPCGIIFIDDTKKHIERVWDAFNESQIETIAIRYSYYDNMVNEFKNSSKLEETAQWEKLKSVLGTIFN